MEAFPSPDYMDRLKIVKTPLLFWLFLFSCSGLEKSESDQAKRENAKAECIYRKAEEKLFTFPEPKHRERELYPWEDPDGTLYPKIIKEFFRCKGTLSNPCQINEGRPLYDCEGFEKHSLPIYNDQEFIYPILPDLLNFIQRKTKKRVVITCGHRCPVHNVYSDPGKANQTSKHLIGAEVDFYVQGLEDRPMEVIEALLQFYKQTPAYRGVIDYENFYRYRAEGDIAVLAWYNKEICIKLYQKHEGRDFDNRHPFAYICIQVRYDRDRREAVSYTWTRAHLGYHRF